MDIQKAEEFKTSKFFCKTNFDMDEIKKEEADYANYLFQSSMSLNLLMPRSECSHKTSVESIKKLTI